MSQSIQKTDNIPDHFHFKRSRLNCLFMEAMKYPIIVVCAGAGYGKTTAVYDFVQDYQTTTVWMQLSDRDNVGGRFWENFSHSMTLINNAAFAMSVKKLGFPDTSEKLKQYHGFMRDHADKKRRVIVFDDCHCIENADVLKFVEEAIRCLPIGITLFLVSRTTPNIDIAGLVSSNKIFNVSEEDLRFTENELSQYFGEHDIYLQPDSLRSIMQDTEGWAFALNFVARSYNKAPGYEGYLRNAMKTNIFRFMEIEIWKNISQRLQIFLVRLSLIDHLSADLMSLLARVETSSGAEEDLLLQLERQNAYVRRDNYINAYLIHPLFLEFLATKQNLLSQEQKYETYTIAGEWCKDNGFKIDALSYYEKIGDYKSIVYMFIGSPSQIPYDISCYAAGILDRAPLEAFDKVLFLASTHMRTIMCQGHWEDAIKLAQKYEARFMNMPADDSFRISTLGSIYYCWGIAQCYMGLRTDIYNFDLINEKIARLVTSPIDPGNLINRSYGPWICVVGSSRKGSVQDFIDTLKRSNAYLSKCFTSSDMGEYELACSEYKFYQGDLSEADINCKRLVDWLRERRKSGVIQKALFYILRIAVAQGNFSQVQQTMKDMKSLLDDTEYTTRFVHYDIMLCWYYCALGLPEKVPYWVKENFSLYADASFVENTANQMKARYYYITRNYHQLLLYIHEMKQRESFLFGRIELLVIEACIHYKLKDKENAYAVFEEAYLTAEPNKIKMPFIELGKDMRTLTSFAQKYKNGKISHEWLEDINRKSASYAKRLSHIVTEYKQTFGFSEINIISPREREILTDLSHGLSRTEIASSRNLSINTVKMLVNNVYMKLGAENLAEAIRVAAERKII